MSTLSWKSIELQVAIPRTQDAGRLQENDKSHQRFQESLAMTQMKQEELKKRQVNHLKESTQSNIRDENLNEKDHPHHKQEPKKEIEKNDETIVHPYLGRKIDYTG